MKYQIVITYKNGSIITLDVPDNYYQDKYSKKPEEKIHSIFMKEFKAFKSALNRKNRTMIEVGDYLKFSNATISAISVLGVDLKTLDEVEDLSLANMSIPGVHDKTYLDLGDTGIDILINKLETTNVIENLDKFLQKVNAMMSKNNVEVTIKAGTKKKATTTTSKKQTVEKEVENNIKEDTSTQNEAK